MSNVFARKSLAQLKQGASNFAKFHPVGKKISALIQEGKFLEAQKVAEEFFGSEEGKALIEQYALSSEKFLKEMEALEAKFPEVGLRILKELYVIAVQEQGIERHYCVHLIYQKLRNEYGEGFPIQRLWKVLETFEKHFVKVEGYKYVPLAIYKMPASLESKMMYYHNNMWMVCPPKKLNLVKGKWQNGYTILHKKCVSKHAINHAKGVSNHFLDIQNATAWVINWEWFFEYGIDHCVIPNRKPGQSDIKYQKVKEDALAAHKKKVFFLCVLYFLGVKNIYILNFQDFRGRVYPFQTEFNPQGSDWDKALLCFPKEKVTRKGLQAFGISIANAFNNSEDGDLDKQLFPARYKWFCKNCKPLFKLEKKAFIKVLKEMAKKADSANVFVAQMLDAYQAWNTLWKGEEVYVSAITHWDSTASGYQLQAIIFGDRKMALLTNLIDPKKRYDLYTELHKKLIEKGFPSQFSRVQVKLEGFVPFVYGGTSPMYELLKSHYGSSAKGLAKAKKYLKLFVDFMTETFVSCREARSIMEQWNALADSYSFTLPNGFVCKAKVMKEVTKTLVRKVRTRTNDEYEVEYKLKWEEQGCVDHSAEWNPNIIHALDAFILQEIVYAMNYNPKWKRWIRHLMLGEVICEVNPNDPSVKRMQYLLECAEKHQWYSLLILKSVTPHNIDMVPKKVLAELYNRLAKEPCQLALIHDSFGVHPNYAWEINRQYLANLELLKKSRYYLSVKEELLGLEQGSLISYGNDLDISNAVMHVC